MANKIQLGEFLVNSGIITASQLNEALDLQRFNKDRRVGEILVTMGILDRDQLVMSIEMFIIESGSTPQYVDEWLDQEEIDMIQEKIKENG
jgi:hypothetical protein